MSPGWVAVWACLGLVIGVSADLLIRLLTTRREDTAGDVCPACAHPIVDWRIVPIAGPLLAGRCAKCGNRYSLALAIQLATAAAFLALAWRWTFGITLVAFSLYAALLVVVFVVDLRHRLILDVVTFPAMLIALSVSGPVLGSDLWSGVSSALIGGAFGGGLFLTLFLLAAVLYRRDDALGMGDVKLALLIGLMTGWPRGVAAILLGTILGAVIGVGVMLRERSGRATMPYGTALALGSFVSMMLPLA